MALLEFNPVAWAESAKNAGLEREVVNALISTALSAQIAFMWESGASKLAQWIGEGRAMQDAATAMYLSLQQLEKSNFLVLSVPKELLDANNLARFQTEFKTEAK